MFSERPFDLFGFNHTAVLSAVFFLGVLLVHQAARLKPGSRRAFEWGFASYVLLQYLLERVWYWYAVGYPARELLPFHLCGISTVLSAVLLVTRNRRLFEVLYFWGIVGASMGMFMPELEYDFPHPLFLTYFTGHASIVYVVAYQARVYRYRPTPVSLKRTFYATHGYAAFAALLNIALGTNYLFLCQKPAGGGLVDFLGPWPVYLVWLEVLGILACSAVYLPWALRDRLRRTPPALEPALDESGE